MPNIISYQRKATLNCNKVTIYLDQMSKVDKHIKCLKLRRLASRQ